MDFASTFASNHVKKFHLQHQLCLDGTPDLDQKVVPTLEDFFATDDSDFPNVSNNFAEDYAVEF